MSGGGFFPQNDSQNADSPAKARGGFGSQNLKSLTIRQIQDGETNTDGKLTIDRQELSQFSFIACVRGVKEVSTGTDYLVEDGTSSITARCWPDKNIAPAKEGEWVRIYGTFKSVGTNKSINVLAMKKVIDFNEVTFHFLESITCHLLGSDTSFLKSFSNGPVKKEKESKQFVASFSDDQNLTPIQKTVYSFYQSCTDDIGVNIQSVVRSLTGRYSEHDIKHAVNNLISEGLIYLTIDSDHARNISA